MPGIHKWYRRSVTVTLLFLGCITLSLIGLFRLSFGEPSAKGSTRFTIIIEHFGFNPEYIEKTITMPLENELSVLPAMSELRSISEYGKSILTCTLRNNLPYKSLYCSVQNAVERAYEAYPDSVQPPRLYSSGSSRKPICIIAFRPVESLSPESLETVRNYVEYEMKPKLSRIDGTGEIEIGGGNRKEIRIEVNIEAASQYGITLSEIGRQIQHSQVITATGTIQNGPSEVPVIIDGKDISISQIDDLPITLPEGETVLLRELAEVTYGNRDLVSVSRVNGMEHIVVYVYGNGNVSLPVVSKRITATLENTHHHSIRQIVLYDSGAIIRTSLIGVIKSLLWAFGIVIFFFTIFSRNLKQIATTSGFLLVSLIISAGILSFLSVSVDHYILASFAVGMGLIIDIGIVIGDFCTRPDFLQKRNMKEITAPLFSSAITTIAVLVPLYWDRGIITGGKQIATGITVLLLAALFLGYFFLPAFIAPQISRPGQIYISHRTFQPPPRMQEILYRLVHFSCSKRKIIFIAYCLFILTGGFSVLSMGSDFSPVREPDRLFAHIEFEPGASLQSVDARTGTLTEYLRDIPGIKEINTLAKAGNGEMTIQFDPEVFSPRELHSLLTKTSHKIPNCFIYSPEGLEKDERKKRVRRIELILTGPEIAKLRETERRAAAVFDRHSNVVSTVLQFKASPPSIRYTPLLDKYGEINGSATSIARYLWNQLHGPVIVKWPGLSGEIDMRISGERSLTTSASTLEMLPVPDKTGKTVSLARLGSFTEVDQASRIYRWNRQRAVYLTLHCRTRNIETLLRSVQQMIEELPLQHGYTFTIGTDIFAFRRQIKKLLFLILLAFILMYMILAAQFEHFLYPLIILGIVPVTAIVPLVISWIGGHSVTVATLIGIIMLSGTGINNGILIAHRYRMSGEKSMEAILSALRFRGKTLFLTSGTTICGTVPLFFLSGFGADFMKQIAFVLLFGTLGSVITSLTFIPAFISYSFTKKL